MGSSRTSSTRPNHGGHRQLQRPPGPGWLATFILGLGTAPTISHRDLMYWEVHGRWPETTQALDEAGLNQQREENSALRVKEGIREAPMLGHFGKRDIITQLVREGLLGAGLCHGCLARRMDASG
ncbi:hypothetical protein M426DRAFT_7802 [Hypoxylon sp. CI-4A]|nr:hypothetical protein M426DRAFT_7802 [Hypoxylon sp. CI-4A]